MPGLLQRWRAVEDHLLGMLKPVEGWFFAERGGRAKVQPSAFDRNALRLLLFACVTVLGVLVGFRGRERTVAFLALLGLVVVLALVILVLDAREATRRLR
jgi:hypothetical protein